MLKRLHSLCIWLPGPISCTIALVGRNHLRDRDGPCARKATLFGRLSRSFLHRVEKRASIVWFLAFFPSLTYMATW
jgi:hypothetical protein